LRENERVRDEGASGSGATVRDERKHRGREAHCDDRDPDRHVHG
jgi:hypothetical protein